MKSIYIFKKYITLLCVVFFSITLNAQFGGGFGEGGSVTISGPLSPSVNQTANYSLSSEAFIYDGNWSVNGGIILSQSTFSASIQWTSTGWRSISFTGESNQGLLEGSLSVFVEGSTAPPTPQTPNISTQTCSNATLTRLGVPGNGITWYWQGTNPSGTSTFNSSGNYTVTSTGTYYLRARNSSGQWSINSSSRYVSLGTIGGQTWYADTDGDSLGDPNDTMVSCTQPSGYVLDASDQCPTQAGTSANNGCPVSGISANENYVHTITPQIAVDNTTQLIDNEDALESITYFDGLGRAKQAIAIKQSASEKDIITHITYDPIGRRHKEYLPYTPTVGGGEGSYRNAADALSGTNNYYITTYGDDINSNAPNPYSETMFEASPLNRPLQQAAPGYDWRIGGGHEIEFDYQSNASNEVRLYEVEIISNANNTFTPSLVLTGYYNPGELYKTTTRDENHTTGVNHSTEEFKDKEGRVILKRTYNAGVTHDTYYVYDEYGNLSYVLPPKSEPQSTMPNAPQLDELCYQYVYDLRNRLVEKKIPGKGWEYIVYNKLDQPIMTKDAQNNWLFTKYDPFGRVAYTGLTNDGTSARITLQTNADNATTQFEMRGNGLFDYTNTAYPNTVTAAQVLTVNYYDNYSAIDANVFTMPTSVYGQSVATNVQSLPTGSKVRILGTDDWTTTVTHYDAKARPIYVKSQNEYLNTTDIVESKLDFAGKVEETKTTHTKTGNAPVVIVDQFFYDHATRLVKQTQQIDNGPTEVIVENAYDEVGLLIDKGVGGKITQNRLQNVDYTYNVRGWLKTINDVNNLGTDLFSFKINYNEGSEGGLFAPKLYNGNIGMTQWRTANDNIKRGHNYLYDNLNRITAANFKSGNNLDQQSGMYQLFNVSYDKNGNLLTLRRNGKHPVTGSPTGMDNLTYAYDSGNKLLGVEDAVNWSFGDEGFRDGTNTGNDYTYDANGNMKTDANKGITNINYNHLNLPTFINALSTGNITYVYDATGVKQRKILSNPGGTVNTDYAGNFIYENSALKFFNHPEGYVEPNGSSWKYVYQCKDHLGNVRLSYADENGNGSVNSSEIREENNYYPFGLKHKGYNDGVSAFNNGTADNWTYNGKELQEELGLNWHDYGWRNYDASIGRWMNLDPLAEDYSRTSPYVYTLNNPIFYIDPDGQKVINRDEVDRKKAAVRDKKAQAGVNSKASYLGVSSGASRKEWKQAAKAKGGNKEWKLTKNTLSEAKSSSRSLKRLTKASLKTQAKIDEFKKNSPKLFAAIDNITNQQGETVDVAFTTQNLKSDNNGFSFISFSVDSKTGDVRLKSESGKINQLDVFFNSTISKSRKEGTVPTSLEVTKHEMGHADYIIRNTRAYRDFLIKNRLLNRSYDGHGKGDLSGKRAEQWQKMK